MIRQNEVNMQGELAKKLIIAVSLKHRTGRTLVQIK